MRRLILALFVAFALVLPEYAATRTTGAKKVYVKGYVRKDGTYVPGHYRSAPGSGTSATSSGSAKSGCTTCPRDPNGRIKRSAAAKAQFMRQTGYPHGRPGYVVDHIIPLECGGADTPSNTQW